MRRRIRRLLSRSSSTRLVRLGCYFGIVGMLLMSWSVLYKAALPVVIGMSFGQIFGGVAMVLYGLAVLGEIYRDDDLGDPGAFSVPPSAAPPRAVPPSASPPRAVPPSAAPPRAVPPSSVPPRSAPPRSEPPGSEPPSSEST
jgi:hypothetical protein